MNDVEGFIIEQKKKWAILELTEFPVEGPEIEALKVAFNHPNLSMVERNRARLYIPIETGWPMYYQGLSSKFKKT